ncbi:heterodisulfide reductase subunit C [Dysgonomonas sp. PH5-45]|uniref:4Fe-4S dicluster domain-containing protein n=1 Tax=unclassified Dysgonomonas TaxID=2630389 RepID=UPI002474833B|nr:MULTISPECIES: 4Fe-4S dicluster domain-containing protein [unclassified Dysgonomonas]MDH6354407.1 heterodisulfide reductase subunit C [Dysgonomonas sp. PH5-45]MDH6387306.1 heterodisulfide reductase subunit C [Dysgonomonas sp. PH5-37]
MEKSGYISEIKEYTEINVNRCYQCGKCSAGCAIAGEMDYPPSMVMRMLQTNNEENYQSLLQSQSIWLCVSCQNCVTRCPMEIDIPRLMDYMREKAYREKKVNRKSSNILSFHKAFLDSVKHTGRLYEIGLVAGYKIRTLNILQDMDVAPSMFMKGKLPILPEMVKDKKQLTTIFKETEKDASSSHTQK